MTSDPLLRETLVLGAVVSLVDSLLDDFDPVDLLTELTEHCTALLDVASAGLLLADSRRRLHVLAATSETTHELDLFQLQADEGPCLDCYLTGDPVSVAELVTSGDRWPRFVTAATDAGIVSVHAVPVRAAGNVLGALGLFSTTIGQLSDADQLLAQSLAHVACVAILTDHPPTVETVGPRLRAALGSRVVVHQAEGFLSERLGITVANAFWILRRYARNHGEHLTDVARQLLTDVEGRPEILATMRQMAWRPS